MKYFIEPKHFNSVNSDKVYCTLDKDNEGKLLYEEAIIYENAQNLIPYMTEINRMFYSLPEKCIIADNKSNYVNSVFYDTYSKYKSY